MLRAALLGCLLAAATAAPAAPLIARAGNATRARRRLSVDYQEVAKLVASDAATGDNFGSVAIDGNTIVVGAYQDDSGGSGSAYVLRTSDGGATYVEVAKLTAADAAAEDFFGFSVAIDGNTVVVGARYDDDAGSMSGSAYVFRTSDGGATYDQVAKLTAADAAAEDQFGVSVAIDGDTIVIGAYKDNSGRGSVYVFRTTDGGATYGQVAKLTASDAAEDDYFGRSVAIDGNTVVVGAYGNTSAMRLRPSSTISHFNMGSIWSSTPRARASASMCPIFELSSMSRPRASVVRGNALKSTQVMAKLLLLGSANEVTRFAVLMRSMGPTRLTT